MDAAVLHPVGKPPRCEQFPEPVAGYKEVIVHVHVEQQQMHPQEAWSTGGGGRIFDKAQGRAKLDHRGMDIWVYS